MESRVRTSGNALRITLLVFTFGLIAGGLWVFLSATFRIDDIEINGNAFITDNEIEASLEPFRIKGKHMFLVDLHGLAEFLEEDPRIASASFEKQFPNHVRLVLKEEVEFATLELPGAECVVINTDGKFIRKLADDESHIGPFITGFSDIVLDTKKPEEDLRAQFEIWSGLTSNPSRAGKLREFVVGDERDMLREGTRYFDALRLAEITSISRCGDVSRYDYIGLDGNYDLFLSYPDRPPIVVGGVIEGHDLVMSIDSILSLDDSDIWDRYDYIDLHMPEYARGIILAEIDKVPGQRWSDGKEAVDVAIWKVMGELESRLGI